MKKLLHSVLAGLFLMTLPTPGFAQTSDTGSRNLPAKDRHGYHRKVRDIVAQTLSQYIGKGHVYGDDGEILESFYRYNLSPELCVAPKTVPPHFIHTFSGAYNIKANYWLRDLRSKTRLSYPLAASEICDLSTFATNTPHEIIRRVQAVM